MSDSARQLRLDGAQRLAARRAFDSRLAMIKDDVEARGVGGRIADSVTSQAHAVADQALEIAEENRGVIGGTIAALAIWFLRDPLLSLLARVTGRDDD